MTAHWRDTGAGAELVVGGRPVAAVDPLTDDGKRWIWSAWLETLGNGEAPTKPAAQQAAERALGVTVD